MITRNVLAMSATAAVLTVTACASSSTTPEAAPAPQAEAPVETVLETVAEPAGIDATMETEWFSVEKLWPDSPYMSLVNSSLPDVESYALSFACNVDTGELTGTLAFQPVELTGKQAMFGLTTSEGYAADLKGAYELGEDGGAFTFPVDWLTMKKIADAGRTDIVSPEGDSHIAIVAPEFELRGGAKLMVSNAGFKAHQTNLYFYCNPK